MTSDSTTSLRLRLTARCPGFKNTFLPRPFCVGSPCEGQQGSSSLVRKASTRLDGESRPGPFTRPGGSSQRASWRTLHPSHGAAGGRRWGKGSSPRWGWGGSLPALAAQQTLRVSRRAGTDGDGRVSVSTPTR